VEFAPSDRSWRFYRQDSHHLLHRRRRHFGHEKFPSARKSCHDCNEATGLPENRTVITLLGPESAKENGSAQAAQQNVTGSDLLESDKPSTVKVQSILTMLQMCLSSALLNCCTGTNVDDSPSPQKRMSDCRLEDLKSNVFP